MTDAEKIFRRWGRWLDSRLFLPLGGSLVAVLVVIDGLLPGSPLRTPQWVDRVLLALLFVALAAQRWRQLRGSSDSAPASAPAPAEAEPILPPAGGESGSEGLDLARLAYREAGREVERLRQRTREAAERALHDRRETPGAAEARQVTELVGELCRLTAGSVDPLTLERWQERAARLQGAAAASAPRPNELAVELQPPEQWLAGGRGRELEYLEYLVVQRRKLLAEVEERERPVPPAAIDWRSTAEQLQHQVASLQSSGSPAGCALEPLQRRLLDLLAYDQIAPRPGDPIDRDVHQIETLRRSREMAPNRVLRLITPGIRVRGGGAVRRKALVEMSEQFVS